LFFKKFVRANKKVGARVKVKAKVKVKVKVKEKGKNITKLCV
jgi:hypothetical protein